MTAKFFMRPAAPLPKPHKDPVSANRRATAPYNFVRLPEGVLSQPAQEVPGHDAFREDCCSGRIDCALETLQPVYVRGAWTPTEFRQHQDDQKLKDDEPETPEDHFGLMKNKAEPFAHGNQMRPRLPARSLRGMIRAVFAVSTYSRVDPIDERSQMSYRGVGDSSSLGSEYLDAFLDYRPLSADDREYQKRAAAALQLNFFPMKRAKLKMRAGYIERRGEEVCIRPAETTPTTVGDVSFFRVDKAEADAYLQACGFAPNRHHCVVHFAHGEAKYFEHGTTKQEDAKGNTIDTWKRLRLAYARAEKLSAAPDAPVGAIHTGTLVCTGAGGGKKLQCVFNPRDTKAPLFQITPAALAEIVDLMKNSKPVNATDPHPQESMFDRSGALKDGTPVFYLAPTSGRAVDKFGWTMMFRIAYRTVAPDDFSPAYAASVGEVVDLTEGVFGWISGRHADGRRGRLRFSSGKCETAGQVLWNGGNPLTLKPLAAPKPTTFQHYLTQSSDEPRQLRHYGHQGQATIRGAKRYWPLRERLTPAAVSAGAESFSQLTRVKAIRPETTFSFSIRFQNLRPEELGALLWALKPRKAGDDAYQPVHKLGMAKALGFGTVKITPTLFLEQKRGTTGRYGRLFDGAGWHEPPVPSAPTPQALIEGFEKTVLNSCKACEPPIAVKGSALSEQPRIAELIEMMDGRGMPSRSIATLVVTTTGRNDFRKRRVLPSASQVARESR